MDQARLAQAADGSAMDDEPRRDHIALCNDDIASIDADIALRRKSSSFCGLDSCFDGCGCADLLQGKVQGEN